MEEWPSWHPDQELKAEHLRALEDYLITRVAMIDDGAWGVESLEDWRKSIRLDRSDQHMVIRVGQLRGVTPAGEHVWLWSEDDSEWLHAPIETGNVETITVDIWVAVNSRVENSPKLTLHAKVLTSADSEVPILSADEPHKLYIGRYRASIGSGTELVHRPMVRRLCGFGAVDDQSWREWVSPFIERLDALLAEVSNGDPRLASPAVAIELSRLSFEWPTLPTPILARRLKMIGWLRERLRNPGLAPDYRTTVFRLPVHELTGDALPQALAELLPLKIDESEGLGASFDRLLRQLLEEVNYHAPLVAIRTWSEHLANVRPSQLSGETSAAVFQRIENTLVDCGGATSSEWARTVALLTAFTLQKNTGWICPQPCLEPYLKHGHSNLPAEIANAFDELFISTAPKARAGPMAFYWLARAVAQYAQVWHICSSDLQAYFTRMTGPGTAGNNTAPRATVSRGAKTSSTSTEPERVSRFLARSMGVAPVPTEVRPYLWSRNAILNRGEITDGNEVCITVVGGPQSGKTTFVREVVRACNDSSGAPLPFDIRFDSRQPLLNHDLPVDETEGRLIVDGRTMRVRLVDAGSLPARTSSPNSFTKEAAWPSAWRWAAHSDLLVLTIEPRAVSRGPASEDVAGLVALSQWTLQQNRNATIAIAFTKADEYGVVEQEAIRFVTGDAQSKLLQGFASARETERVWKAFVQGASTASSGVRHEGLASFPGRGSSVTRETEWSPTRRWILEQTRELWDVLLRQEPPALLNAYFVCAEPRDPYLEPWPRRGLVQVLADYFSSPREGADGAHKRESASTPLTERGRQLSRRPLS